MAHPHSEIKEGDRVVYQQSAGTQQTSVGVIKKILTEAGTNKEPRFLIENVQTKNQTVHGAEHIIQKSA